MIGQTGNLVLASEFVSRGQPSIEAPLRKYDHFGFQQSQVFVSFGIVIRVAQSKIFVQNLNKTLQIIGGRFKFNEPLVKTGMPMLQKEWSCGIIPDLGPAGFGGDSNGGFSIFGH